MPIHNWTRVDVGIFHHFHQHWIVELTNILNKRLLPKEYYALTEAQSAGFEPDVLTLKTSGTSRSDSGPGEALSPRSRPAGNGSGTRHEPGTAGMLVVDPRVQVRAETDLEFFRRKQSVTAVRHASDDQLVAIIEIVSRGNKSGRKPYDDFVHKAVEFLSHQVHLLIIDLQPPTPRDPQGIHGAIWSEISGEDDTRPVDKPLTLAAYDSGASVRAFVEPVSVGDPLIDMPLFLEPGRYVAVPLEETYQAAFNAVPRPLQQILETG